MGTLKQSAKQKQNLTPQQLQLLRFLSIPATDLEQVIKEELQKNLLLEEDKPSDNSDFEQQYESDGNEEPEETDDERQDNELNDNDSLTDYLGEEDDVFRNSREESENPTEYYLSSGISLPDHIVNQLNFLTLTPRQRSIAMEIVGSLDDGGYLSRDLNLIVNDLAFTQGIETTLQETEEVLEIVQSLDPAGIGARSVQECLALQLRRIEHYSLSTRIALAIIEDYFDDFTHHRQNKIKDSLGIDNDALESATEIIQHLTPRPGALIGGDHQGNNYVMPDFVVSREGDKLSFVLNNQGVPSVHISQHYNDMLQSLSTKGKTSPDEQKTISFLKEQAESAQGFIDVLNQRRNTLSDVMRVILERQKDYFLTGDSTQLKPLLQKEVATATQLDISTISRVVNQKYVQTEFGTFLLKNLFSQSITDNKGNKIATEAIKTILTDIISHEDKQKPYTDEELAQILQAKGYPMALRTVTKYRNQIGFPTSRLRIKNF